MDHLWILLVISVGISLGSGSPSSPSSHVRFGAQDSNRSQTETQPALLASVGQGDTRDSGDRAGRVQRQAGRSALVQRTRTISRPISGSAPSSTKRLTGPHVCGGQCCSGWAIAPGTNRCIKPNCQPPCENRGSCSRPHTCVCRSGFQGARCEEVTPEQVYIRTGTSRVLTPYQPGTDSSQHQPARRRPTERQAIDTIPKTQTPKPPTSRAPHSTGTQVKRGSPDTTSQHTGTSRTVKRYPSSTAPITSNALPNGPGHSHGHPHYQHTPDSNDQTHASQSNGMAPTGANLTANVDRIKIIFTPMVCKRICHGGQCYNSCERGDKTTVYTESQGPPIKSQGFRLFFCQIPCLNGGRCIGQNECWCPSNSTGKFCHLPAPPPSRPVSSRDTNSNKEQMGSSHTVYTLPLSNQQLSMLPSLVKVHVQHPPEAHVQIHQVAMVKPGQSAEPGHSVQQRSQPGNGHTSLNGNGNGQNNVQVTVQNNGQSNYRPHDRQHGLVGRCFQETVDGKCGKPLPGLTKQEDCCGSVGASWGLNKCTQCPSKPAYAVIANGRVECPKGFKRMNSTHCQDINECLMQGICKHAECLNTRGSYRCTCKPGYMLDPARSHCVSDKAVSMEKGSCYRSVLAGSCSHPLSQKITKQICCCSGVGRAWGPACERCPVRDSDHFKEICPAGPGYTYSHSDIKITMREMDEDELTAVESSLPQFPTYPEAPRTIPDTPYHGPQAPTYPRNPYNKPFVPSYPQAPVQPEETLNVPFFTDSPHLYPDVVEVTPQPPTHLKPDSEDQDKAPIDVATQVTDIDKCTATPRICGPGQCVSVQSGYTCYCDPGYTLNALQTNCIDINECENDPCGGKGRCVNALGSYTCQCFPGFSLVMTQNSKSCQDVNECALPNTCPNGVCVNTDGSFRCECKNGFTKNQRGQCEDVDECRRPGVCPSGKCVNTQGSFQCQACGAGFRPEAGRCLDVNECQMPGRCTNGNCVNTEGSFTCTCNPGYQKTPDNNNCQDVNECLLPGVCTHGTCVNIPGSYRCNCNTGYQSSPDSRACVDEDECAEPSLCVGGVCINTIGSFTCTHCESGYTLSEDRQSCEDVDECLSLSLCPNGICLNSQGSFHCEDCPTGFTVSADGELCEDIDECQSPGVCPTGVCTNTEGSYSCITCDSGYRPSSDHHTCEDIDECEDRAACLNGQCTNTAGSYHCVCPAGFELVDAVCRDVNECLSMDVCVIGECLNTEGSFLCICPVGYAQGQSEMFCQDVDECAEERTCFNGQCLNTDGSYDCVCRTGYRFSASSKDCEDLDECKEYSDVCGTWACENTMGSYRCVRNFQELPSSLDEDSKETDMDECEMICGKHAFCENTNGSYTCHCDQGYTIPPDGQGCVDMNECENSRELCGEAMCENVEGTFLCLCHNDNEEFDPATFQCVPRRMDIAEASEKAERKECYYNLNDANLCENVLSRNITKQECCCTVGAGWGDNCEIHPCPIKGQAEYDWLCPHGTGIISTTIRGFSELKDADECEMFGAEFCKDGFCLNTYSSYSCFCRSGYYYDNTRMQCIDYDECKEESQCENGECVNTPGSFNCFCSPPLILDQTLRRCISANSTEVTHELGEDDIHTDICWEDLKADTTCTKPLYGLLTTFTECCCLYGLAWGSQCALCPSKSSEHFAMLCNLPQRGSDSLRERPGFEYGPDANSEGSYLPPYFDNYGENYYSPEGPLSGSTFTDSSNYGSRGAARVPVPRPRENQPPRRVDLSRGHSAGFEGLQAEECGILNGCENGRCVRVKEGYTCDCFDGYELNLNKMACIDINECEDISDSVELCKNGVCSNTEGSYKCTCLPGFLASSKPHECIPEDPDSVPSTGEK
ncbi:latent-transforming growth factor beta-binding protein 2-like [Trichomycterus rosablanca]|uniref:latent-transforming growth factor beta-binding protein 2-like n=1 Tax=Trichomycterus rosablanca TaxID=2290929 RepID=UPI002F35BA71